MKATGMVRRLDDLGRVVIPKELRTTLGWAQNDPLEIFTEKDGVHLKRYTPGCSFCDEITDDLVQLHGKSVCKECREALK